MNLSLKLVISCHSGDVITSISGLSSVIRDLMEAINIFSLKHRDLKIEKIDKGFKLSPKAYIAIQHVVYEHIR